MADRGLSRLRHALRTAATVLDLHSTACFMHGSALAACDAVHRARAQLSSAHTEAVFTPELQ